MQKSVAGIGSEIGYLRVLRLCSVFMPPRSSLGRLGARFDPVGGMQNHTLELTRALDTCGVAQDVVTTRPPGARRLQTIGQRTLVHRLGLPIAHFRQLYSLPAARLLRRISRRSQLIHAHLGEDLAVLPLAIYAARRADAPLVVTVHCSLSHTLKVVDARTAALKLLGGRIENRSLASAEAVIVLTAKIARRLKQDGIDPGRVHVVQPAVDPALFSGPLSDPLPSVRRPRIVFVGRLVAAKGVNVLLEAARRLDDDVHLVIVGDGPERAALEQRTRLHGLGERVSFTGFLDHQDIPRLLAHADILVLPSFYEELGSILIEAMESALPVVASRTGGIPEVVSHGVNGLLVEPGDAGELAAAMARILDDQTLAKRLSKGQRQAARHTWADVGRKVLGIYRAVLADRREVSMGAEPLPLLGAEGVL